MRFTFGNLLFFSNTYIKSGLGEENIKLIFKLFYFSSREIVHLTRFHMMLGISNDTLRTSFTLLSRGMRENAIVLLKIDQNSIGHNLVTSYFYRKVKVAIKPENFIFNFTNGTY